MAYPLVEDAVTRLAEVRAGTVRNVRVVVPVYEVSPDEIARVRVIALVGFKDLAFLY